MSFVIANKTNGLADINLYDGSRVTLKKGEELPLTHTPTTAEAKYYSKLNCVGIFLEKREAAIPVETPKVETPKTPVNDKTGEVEDETEVKTSEDETANTETSDEDETHEETDAVDYTSMEFSKLMQMRQAELISIAEGLGIEGVSKDLSKKEICKLIRGE